MSEMCRIYIAVVYNQFMSYHDVDLFRIKIWDKDDNDNIIYDNNLGNEDDEDPTTEIGGGNIKIHKQ